jgi:thymidylate kinase
MHKKVICFYGGPGTGKSTISAQLFALLKIKGLNVELVREYVKDWVWEKRAILPGDQLYIFAKQCRKERILFQDVDVIITDSPIWLSAIYERKVDPDPMIIPLAIDKQVRVAKSFGFQYVHIFLQRDDKIKYQTEGRFQSLEEAKKIDDEISSYMDRNYPFDLKISASIQVEDLLPLVFPT